MANKSRTSKSTKHSNEWWTSAWFSAVRSLISFALAYALASMAIDNGSLWFYLFAVIAMIRGAQLLIRAFKK